MPTKPIPPCSEETGSAEELIAAGGAPVDLPPPILLAVLDRLLCLEVRLGTKMSVDGRLRSASSSDAAEVDVNVREYKACLTALPGAAVAASPTLAQATWHCGSMLPQTVFTSLYMLQPERWVIGLGGGVGGGVGG